MARAAEKSAQVEHLQQLRSEETINTLFQELEIVAFPGQQLRNPYPQLAEQWDIFSKLQSVPWEWVATLEMSLAGFLGLLHFYQDVLDDLECMVNDWRRTQASSWDRDNTGVPDAGQNSWKARINFSMGSGSLEGEGRVAAQPQNLGRSCAFLTEGKRFFSWLSAEGVVNETIVVVVRAGQVSCDVGWYSLLRPHVPPAKAHD